MTSAHCPAPTTAERIRSTCVRAGGALLAVDSAEPLTTPLHHLLADGSFAVGVPAGGGVADQLSDYCASGAQSVLELADYAPLPLREPVRSLVWISGRLHRVPPREVRETLDLIAAEHPHPALLQVQTPAVAASERGRHPVPVGTAGDRVGGGHRRHRRRGRRLGSAAGRPAGSILRVRIMLDSPPRHRPPRRGRAAGRPAAGRVATGGYPAAGHRPLRHAPAGGKRPRRPRRPATVPHAGRRRRRTGQSYPGTARLPFRERSARATGLSTGRCPRLPCRGGSASQ